MNIDDLSNRWLIHPIGRALLPLMIRLGVSPNSVSLTGFVFGFAAAMAYTVWQSPFWASIGFLLMIGWHVCDGLDGMLARATGRFSDAGRLLDGICDYTTFVLVNLVIAANTPAVDHWLNYILVWLAGACHVVQAAIYEAERERYHRRLRGEAPAEWQVSRQGGAVETFYVRLRHITKSRLPKLDAALSHASGNALRLQYQHAVARTLRGMTLLSANWRTLAIWLSCLAGNPALFWWWEILILSPITWLFILRLRAIERRLANPSDPS